MSSDTFVLWCCGYAAFMIISAIVIAIFSKGKRYNTEDYEKTRMSDDINRMRNLQDIEYYKQVFRNKSEK